MTVIPVGASPRVEVLSQQGSNPAPLWRLIKEGKSPRPEQRQGSSEDPQVAPPTLGLEIKLHELPRLRASCPPDRLGFRVEMSRVFQRSHQKILITGARTIKGAGDFREDLHPIAGLFQHFAHRSLFRRFPGLGFALWESLEVAFVMECWFSEQDLAARVDYDSSVGFPHWPNVSIGLLPP